MHQHQWKAGTNWWDNLAIPSKEIANKTVFTWLEANAPDPEQHDYVLYTDGSGCTKGWGAHASIITPVIYDPESQIRELRHDKSTILMGGTYGSTVQRCEMTAFLDGIHEIIRQRLEAHVEAADEAEKFRISQEGIMNVLTGPDRVSVLWYTDRRNIAEALLFDEYDNPLAPRTSERDLWMRFSAMTRNVCITPIATRRNTVERQAACDTLCSAARSTMKSQFEAQAAQLTDFYPIEKWKTQKSQKAQF